MKEPGVVNKIDEAIQELYFRDLLTIKDIEKIRRRYYRQLRKKEKTNE
jgi:hypothetical protein